jgi:hypothetical protein
MRKESLSTSMAKLVITVSLIVCIGALLGAVGYLAKNKEAQKTAIKKSVDIIDKDLTVESLKNAKYNSIFWKNETIKLKDGSYTREHPDSVSVGHLGIFDDKILFGDLNGDGEKDAVIILDSSFGGTGHFYELAVVVNKNGEPLQIASEDLGDRSIINSLEINDGKIIIDIIIHGPGDGGCCPTLRKIFEYELQNDKLIKTMDYGYNKGIDTNIKNWQTYRNEEYGFEVKYPEDWEEIDKTPAIISFTCKDNKNNIIQIRSMDRENDISLIKQIKGEGDVEPELIKINNKDFYFLKVSMAGLIFYEYYIENKNKIFIISMLDMSADLSKNAQSESDIIYPTDEELSEELNNLRSMISTFKFIEKDEMQE